MARREYKEKATRTFNGKTILLTKDVEQYVVLIEKRAERLKSDLQNNRPNSDIYIMRSEHQTVLGEAIYSRDAIISKQKEEIERLTKASNVSAIFEKEERLKLLQKLVYKYNQELLRIKEYTEGLGDSIRSIERARAFKSGRLKKKN